MERYVNLLHNTFKWWYLSLLLLSIMTVPWNALAEENQVPSPAGDTLITVAREMMKSIKYCALITIDQTGRPHVRTMEPFQPEENMVVWLGTNSKSRKVKEIRNDPRVTLYYADPDGSGYLVITGTAELVDDANEKAKRWKKEWEAFYPDRKDNYLLIKITPENLDILSYRHNIIGNPETWRVPSVDFESAQSKN